MTKRREQIERRTERGSTPNSEVTLSGTLGEFREALRAEVDAAKRASSSGAIPLSNGRRISSLAGGFQYQFEIESTLDLPGDTPGELRLPNLDPIRVSVVAFEGMSIILSIEKDLGAFVPFATLQSNLTMLLLALIERIEKKAGHPNPAGDRLLGVVPPLGDGEHVDNALLEPHKITLNAEQLQAVGSVLGRDTTYIWGPPGTGKTHTIGAIGAELFRRGRSILVVSHTNTAVDGAILQIGGAIRNSNADAVESGSVVRVGTPKDERLRSRENIALLLSEQRERRQAKLATKKTSLTEERQHAFLRIQHLSFIVALHEWLVDAVPDVVRIGERLALVQELRRTAASLESETRHLQARLQELCSHSAELDAAVWAADHALEFQSKLDLKKLERREIDSRLDESQKHRLALGSDLAKALELEPQRSELSKYPTLNEARRSLELSQIEESACDKRLKREEQKLREAESLLADTQAVNWITRKWKELPDPKSQADLVQEFSQTTSMAREALLSASADLKRAEEEVNTIVRLTEFLSPHAALPRASELQQTFDDETREIERLRFRSRNVDKLCGIAESEINAIKQTLDSFRTAYRCEPSEMLAKRVEHEMELSRTTVVLREKLREESSVTESLRSELARRLNLLEELNLMSESPSTLDAMYNSLEVGVLRGRELAESISRNDAEQERKQKAERLSAISVELEGIEEALRRTEETIIREARVVGATLTASYLRDVIQNRRFDTVLLDEASMAAIPAMWCAASLCDRSLVVVGDYRQLPPVVVSKDEIAIKWLGRDPFQLVDLCHDGVKPSYFVGLRIQHRMHPHISDVANKLIYHGVLEDSDDIAGRERTPMDWLSPDWTFADPVLLVDTGPLHAWVTPVSRGGGNASRLNFMSATVCADIACRLLSPERPLWAPSSDPRILIISPYRPHSKLISLLLKDDGIQQEVVSGTVHSFQGAQADVVILDLVNDEPHWRVGHFMAMTDSVTERLFNVAITRAKRRLIVVGDFEYCSIQGKKAFLGSRFIPYLHERHKTISAISAVAEGVASRAAEARKRVFGGSVEVEHDRTVVSQDRFYSLLAADLKAASSRVVVYSPFMTQTRLGEIETDLKAAIERGVSVFVVTKPIQEREKSDRALYRMLEKALAQWQILIIHKRGMHEKLVLIDTNIVWTGSLNPLSFRNTQEVMERRRSPEVFEEYAKTLMLRELLDEYSDGVPNCPICGREVTAAEGGKTPFYWRCIDRSCTFRRGIEDTDLREGDVRCLKCGGDVKLVEKGSDGRARWVCIKNARHKQLVKAMHLQFVKVRNRISSSLLERLERRFEAEATQSRKLAPKQQGGTLFD